MRILKQRKQDRVDRRMALDGVPRMWPGVVLTDGAGGLVRVSMTVKRGGGFLERLRPPEIRRSYELDEFGSFVIRLVDGRRTVLQIVDAFEERFRMSRREVELSVVAFFKLLMQRNVLAVAVPRRVPSPPLAGLLLALLGLCGSGLAAPPPAESTMERLRAIEALGPRSPGSPGNLAIETMVEGLFAQSGFETGEIRFTAPVFEPGSLTLDAGAEGSFTLEAMHPTLMRPGNFARAAFSSRLVYFGLGGSADLERLRGVDLDGAIAVMDFACGDRWLDLLRFGIEGFVFVSDGADTHEQSVRKVYTSEVSVPRFFADGEVGARLRELADRRPGLAVEVRSEPSRWRNGELRNLWALIPGSDEQLSQQVVVLTASMDANAVVPSRAYGAQRAVNLHLLLELLADLRARPPLHSVLLVAINGHTQRYAGERQLAWHLMADEADVEAMRDEIATEMRLARLHATQYGRLRLDPVGESDQDDLHVMMELMWQLDALQRPEREVGRRRLREEAAQAIEQARLQDDMIDVLESLALPELDESLDLAAVTETQMREAIDEAQSALLRGYSRFFARRGRDPAELEREQAEDMAMVEALRAMPHEALMAKAGRIHSVFEDEKLFEVWRGTMDASTGQRLYVKTRLQDELRSQVNRLGQDILIVRSPARTQLPEAEREQRLAELTERRDHLRRVLVLFNKMDIGVGRSRTFYRQIAVEDVQREMLRSAVDRYVTQYQEWQARHQATLDRDAAASAVRRVLGRRRVALAIALEMDAHAAQAGFFFHSPRIKGGWFNGFAALCRSLAQELGLGDEGADFYVDSLLGVGDDPRGHFFNKQANLYGIRLSFVPESAIWHYHAAGRTPAFSLRSVFADHGRLFGPHDRVAHLDPEAVHRLQGNALRFLEALLSSEALVSAATLQPPPAHPQIWSTLLRTYSLEEFSGKPVPTEPIPGTLVALYQSQRQPHDINPAIIDGDVINTYLALADETANAYFYGLAEIRRLAPTAYQMDGDFREVLHVIDKGRVQSSRQASSAVARFPRVTLPMFAAREFVLSDLRDPTMISTGHVTTRRIWPKTAQGQSDPEKFGVHGVNTLSPAPTHMASGPVGVYQNRRRPELDPEGLMVITDSRRLLLNATRENPKGEGFARPAELPADLVRQATADMALLNNARKTGMQGVVNQLLDRFIERSDQLKAEALERHAERNHGSYLRSLYEAFGNQVKAYRELRQMNADMLKAVIVYMALMLPFCFFLQKLLFNFKRMEHELGGFSLLFFSTFLLFRFIHPAFRMAMSPEAIFIAFVLGAIGVFTTGVLRSRFREEMTLLFRGVGGIGEDVGYGTVGTTAMLIGVQNMRRRRIRTSLTTATIVLVVFSMLAFSSVSRTARPSFIPRGPSAPYTGLFYHWPGGAAIDEASYRMLHDLFADRAEVRTRRILQAVGSWRMERTDLADRHANIHTLTGIVPDDIVLRDSMALIEGEPFSSNDADEIFLPLSAADALGLRSEDIGRTKVRLLGREWLLKGLVDEQRYRLARDLNPNLPLVPFATPPQSSDRGGDTLDIEVPNVAENLVDLSGLVIIPEGAAAALGAPPRSVAVVFEEFDDPGRLGAELRRVLDVTEARFYVGSRAAFNIEEDAAVPVRAGIYYVGSSYRTAIGGLARLLIPLIIAGSIILNTMLGTVYERKSEIAVFNAIGLNPTHIFLFFLAEAVVYSFIGAVGGYLIGQVLTIVLQGVGLIRDLNVNFSSLMVVYAILFTMALVILSTLYPGYVATRTAVPSGQRKWTMPEHDGQRMSIVFPFIYRPRMAYGVMYYLRQFFDSMSELSLGDIVATPRGAGFDRDDAGRPVLSLRYQMAMAPYDLGVTQHVTFTARHDEVVGSFRLHMDIERISGHDTNWVTTNRPYLERMRKFLIRWRNIDPTRQDWFVKHALEMFEQTQAAGSARV